MRARVALGSKVCASAAREGLRVPPARETGTGVVGLDDIGAALGGDVCPGLAGAAEEGEGVAGEVDAAGDDVMGEAVELCIVVAIVVPPHDPPVEGESTTIGVG